MTIKEKIIRQSLDVAFSRLKVLEEIQNATPASELIAIKKETRQLLNKNKGIEARTSQSFMDKIDTLSKREEKSWEMVDKQKNWKENSDEMIELTNEISDLKNELFHIERKRKKISC